MTWLKDPPPWLRPAISFASVIVWTENKNVAISDSTLTVKQSAALAACVLRATNKKSRQLVWGKKCTPRENLTWLGDFLTSKWPGSVTALALPLVIPGWVINDLTTISGPFSRGRAIFVRSCSQSNRARYMKSKIVALVRAGLTIRGPHTNVRRRPFSRTRSHDFLWRCTFPPKSWRPFLVVVVTFKPTLNVQTFKRQNSVLKIWQLIGGVPGGGGLPWYNRHNG